MPIHSLALPTALLLAACTPSVSDAQDGRGKCSSEAAERLAGKPMPAIEEIRQLTGASIVRQIAPGDPVTMDLNERRVTVEVAGGRIVRASCG